MTSLYENDYMAWVDSQVELLKKKDFDHLDLMNLIEEMGDLGGYKSAIGSHMEIIMMHMLKQEYQPDYSTKSWKNSIDNARVIISNILEENPGMKVFPSLVLKKCYERAVRYASRETNIDVRMFPRECPWTLEEILGPKEG